ncbi:MAG: 3-isopropylmalate dehydratase large subunit [Bacteroidales bacterium]|jgi:homoaconitate hydratase family protein/3-isopropylmalate dehydratase small subunit|nr:3-isopropylmalate dehydratase large subunit [Bacteroidales bacterium]
MNKTFVEKILNADCGSLVFAKPDIVLTHDNTASIIDTFHKMNGEKVFNANQLLIVLDHNAPPTTSGLADDYQKIRNFVKEQHIGKFYDVGQGICHQIMSYHARPAMMIVGSDSHTCTAGAFNALSAGIDRTESAGLWKQGETWFKVPETIKITLEGKLAEGVYAKDLALWIIGMIGSEGADYKSVEFHGSGVKTLSISDRMALANLASEMGAKNAVFPADEVLEAFIGEKVEGVWADEGAHYRQEININLADIFPVVAVPHHVDNVKAVAEVQGIPIQQGVIGTCTNGRIEDLRIAAQILKGRKLPDGFQLLIIPASKKIYLQAMQEELLSIFMEAGATVLATSCGPCLGTGQGIPATGINVISTANRNFKGRMGNKESFIYLASPATVACSALKGAISDPRKPDPNCTRHAEIFPYIKQSAAAIDLKKGENRRFRNVWNYADINNMNTDVMFAGNLTYNVKSSEPEKILPHLLAGIDDSFATNVKKGDIIIAGNNFGCGSSREHPAVGMAYAGIQTVICGSVNRIFYRSSVNQGLPILVLPEAVKAYKAGDAVSVDFQKGELAIANQIFKFAALPAKLLKIFEVKGLVNYLKN